MREKDRYEIYISCLDNFSTKEIDSVIRRIINNNVKYTMAPNADLWLINYKEMEFTIINYIIYDVDIVYFCEKQEKNEYDKNAKEIISLIENNIHAS